MTYTKEQLKHFTLSHSLFPPTTLEKAIDKLQFVQIDPIRSPAPAQDLILRHRVKNYHVGDMEQAYSSLDLEEDFFFAHGYMKREIWQLLYPRKDVKLTKFDKQILETVGKLGEVHPKDLEKHFGKKSERNWWGGNSRSTKMALDRLHYYGLLRIAKRQKGIRVYKLSLSNKHNLNVEERLTKLVMYMVDILSPVSSKTLSQSFHRIHRHVGNTRPIIKNLLESNQIEQQTIDNITYFWPTGKFTAIHIPQTLKFLAPFDPVVKDRFRFEHLWGWPYQFEAYIPAPKRIRGYYAMPILWGEDIIGWANIKKVNKDLKIDLGFVNKRPKSKKFEQELEKEINRMKDFLSINNT